MSELLLSIGATGSVGRHVLAQAVADGYRVRALVRDPSVRPPEGAEVVTGDLTRPENLAAAVDGVASIVFTHGSYPNPAGVDYGGVLNILTALNGRAARLALMTAIAVTDRKGAHEWKRRAERLVRASGNPFTIVRPGWFDYHAPDQKRLVMLQGDKRQTGTPRDGSIARDQLARVLVRSLRSDAAAFKTLELVSETGSEQPDLDPVFAALDADTSPLDGARDAANMPMDLEPDAVRAAFDAIRGLSSRLETA